MKLTEEDLKELNRQRTARSVRGQAECLAEELLFRAAAKELTRQERKRVIQHLRACSDCAREYHIVHSARQWAGQVAPAFGGQATGAQVPARRGRWATWLQAPWNQIVAAPRWRAAAVIAALVIAVGVTLIAWPGMQRGEGPVPGERGGGRPAMRVDPPDFAELGEVPRQLSWSQVESAESYQVMLYDFELTPIWESPAVTGTSVQIPESVRAGLQRGRPTYWRVIVSSGIERRWSALFQFTLTTDAPQ